MKMSPVRFLVTAGLLAVTVVSAAAEEPRVIAEAALLAMRDSDAVVLNRIAHPELKKRLRGSRLLTFYRGQKNDDTSLDHVSDDKVVQLFCEAHKEIAPRDSRVEYFDDYVSTKEQGNYAVVSFDSGWRSKTSAQTQRTRSDVVLKKSGEKWLFLWSPAMNIHVDLEWDARNEIPGRPVEPSGAVPPRPQR